MLDWRKIIRSMGSFYVCSQSINYIIWKIRLLPLALISSVILDDDFIIFICLFRYFQMSQGFKPEKYVTKSMPLETVIKMKEVFDIFDYDHSGQISIDELVNTIKALEMEDSAKNILSIVQSSTSAEELDFQAFLNIFGYTDTSSEASLQQLYEAFDPQGTNCFGPEDFEKVAESVGERFSAAEVDQMIDYADKDRDGGINFEEFCATVTRQYPKV